MTRSALVLDGGSGPSLATVRSLGRAGWRVGVQAGTRAAASRWAARAFPFASADEDGEAFVAGVADALAAERFDLVVPTTDASVELLWAHAEMLGDTRILGADRSSYDLASDKARGLAAADAAGFGTPAWLVPESLEEARAGLERTGLPCVVKPRRSYVVRDGRLRQRRHGFVREPRELEAALAAHSDPEVGPPVLQAFVPGRSLSVSAVIRGGTVLGMVARETLTFDPIAGGTSVWKRTTRPDDVGVDAAVELLRSIGYDGLAEVEYQVDAGGRERLMEIGVRAHGWIALAAAAGVDLVLIAARAAVGDELSPAPPYRPGVEMRWPVGELNRLRDIARRAAPLPPGTTRLDVLAALWPPWRPGMRYDGIDLRDPVPWLPAGVRRRLRAGASTR